MHAGIQNLVKTVDQQGNDSISTVAVTATMVDTKWGNVLLLLMVLIL